jgi:hypothetical protein
MPGRSPTPRPRRTRSLSVCVSTRECFDGMRPSLTMRPMLKRNLPERNGPDSNPRLPECDLREKLRHLSPTRAVCVNYPVLWRRRASIVRDDSSSLLDQTLTTPTCAPAFATSGWGGQNRSFTTGSASDAECAGEKRSRSGRQRAVSRTGAGRGRRPCAPASDRWSSAGAPAWLQAVG